MPAVLPAPTWPGVLARWEPEPAVVGAVAVAAVAYQMGWRATAGGGAGSPASRRRRRRFLAGLATVVVALCSPIAAYADDLFWVHVVEHLMLTLVAAPLLVAGRALDVTAALLRPADRHRLVRLRRSRLLTALGHPLVGWLAFAAAGWVVHFTPWYDRALVDPAAHAAEHGLLLGTALLFWRPVMGTPVRRRLSHPLRVLYLVLAMPQETFLALVIYTSPSPLYRNYLHGGRSWGPSPLADQHAAGGLLWVVSELALLVAVLATANAWATSEARLTARREALEDAAAGAAAPSGNRR